MPSEDLCVLTSVSWQERKGVLCAPLRLQSAQSLFSGCLTNSRRIFALRSVVALSALYIVLDVVVVWLWESRLCLGN